MKILERYIFKSLWGPFIFGLIGTTLIIALDPMQRAINFHVQNKVEAWVAFRWFLSSLPKDMLFIFPTSCLLAGLLVFANLSKKSEMIAIRAGGIGFFAMLKPVTAFSFLVFLLVLAVQDLLIPPALYERKELFRKYVRQVEEPKFRDNIVMRLSRDRLLFIGQIDLVKNELKRLVIQEKEGNVLSAQSAYMNENGKWVLENLYSGIGGNRFEDQVRMNIYENKREYDLELTKRDLSQYEILRPEEMTYREIFELIRYHEKRGVLSTTPLWVDFFSKTAFPFASVIFTILGSCLGLSSARGGGFKGFGISLAFSFIYFLITGFATPLGKNGMLSPFLAGWLQNIIFIFVLILVLYRASKA